MRGGGVGGRGGGGRDGDCGMEGRATTGGGGGDNGRRENRIGWCGTFIVLSILAGDVWSERRYPPCELAAYIGGAQRPAHSVLITVLPTRRSLACTRVRARAERM